MLGVQWKYQSPFVVHGLGRHYLHELRAIEPRVTHVRVASLNRSTQWIAPPAGLAKLNVDAVVGRGGSYGVVGAIWRDQASMFLGELAVVFPNISEPAT